MSGNVGLIPRGVETRTEPIQARSTERITLLLDTAAELIARGGINGITTSTVAANSGSSIGVVYRYFTDIQRLLDALAARNVDRFLTRVAATIGTVPSDLQARLDGVIDTYVAFMRDEPGFRAIRFGDVLHNRVLLEGRPDQPRVTDDLVALLTADHDTSAADGEAFELEVLLAVVDRLLRRAFQYEPRGDERFITAARGLVGDQVR